jgi:peptide/nickel transport system ATP-binding protein
MLDAITQAQIWHAVLKIAEKRNMGIVVVSHEAKLVQRICHREIQFGHFNAYY